MRITAEERTVSTTVSDTGIGIPPINTSPFSMRSEQGDGSVAREYGGTIGLTVTKQLVELHMRTSRKSEPGSGKPVYLYTSISY